MRLRVTRTLGRKPVAVATDSVLALNPLGLWYGSNYLTSPVKHIPNSASSLGKSSSWLRLPRRTMNWNQVQNSGGTITDAAGTALDGTTSAFRLQIASSGAWRPLPVTVTAGTWTIVFEVKSNTGSNQTFAIVTPAGTTSGFVATTTMQRFSVTGTLSAGSSQFFISANAGALDLLVGNVQLYPGSSDIGEPAESGHLYLGRTANDFVPTYASGELDFSASNAMGWISFAASTSYTQFTAVAVGSRVSAASGFHNYIGKANTSFSDFGALFEAPGLSKGPITLFGSSQDYGQPAKNLFYMTGAGYHVFTARYDGTKVDFFVDDVRLFSKTYSAGTTAVQDYVVGVFGALNNSMGYKINSMALFNIGLSDSTIRNTVVPSLMAKATSDGLTINGTTTNRILVAEGDSITFGFGASNGSYASLYMPNASPKCFGNLQAVSGATLATVSSRASAVDAILPPSLNGRKFILSVLIGTNDLQTYSGGPSQYLTDLAAYCNARRTAGWKVAVGTVLPRADLSAPNNATFNANRATFNTGVRTWVGTNCDAVFDFAADATMGPDAAASNATYYGDSLHPTNAGQAILETIYRAAIDAM